MEPEHKEALIAQVKNRYDFVAPFLSERDRRILMAAESQTIGHGGNTIVQLATGISRVTINNGKKELDSGLKAANHRIRKPGGGRKKLIHKNPDLAKELDKLIDPLTRGDPESPLRWTCKSTYKLADALQCKGFKVSQKTVYTMLQEMGYSMQANHKILEGKQNPDRDAQFHFINNSVIEFQECYQPVISVDAKKKENIGQYKNMGVEWEPQGKPVSVNTYDFPNKESGKACPYGIYDLSRNEGWVSVGISSDTAQFAVGSIRRWWDEMGCFIYPGATRLLITADGGGSNGYRLRLWKNEIQSLSNELGLKIHVCHFPPGTSKWNKIEHQMFSFMSKNWRGRPLDSLSTIVNLIAGTTTKKGLKIKAEIDPTEYNTGIKISDQEMATLNIIRDDFHGEWNYTIMPHEVGFHNT